MERLLRVFQGVLWDLACFTNLSLLILWALITVLPWWILLPTAVLAQNQVSAQQQRIESLARSLDRHERKIDLLSLDVQRLRTDMAVVKRDVGALTIAAQSQDTLFRDVIQGLIGLAVLVLGGQKWVNHRHAFHYKQTKTGE